MDAKRKLKIGKLVYFLIQKRIKNPKQKNKRFTIESGKIHKILDDVVVIKTKKTSYHNRTFATIYFSKIGAEKSI